MEMEIKRTLQQKTWMDNSHCRIKLMDVRETLGLYLLILLSKSGCITRLILKRSTAGLNSIFLLLDWLPYQE